MHFSRESKLTVLVGVVGILVLLSAQSEDPTILGRFSLRYLAIVLAYAIGTAAAVLILSRPVPRLPAAIWLGTAAICFFAISHLTLLDHTWWLNATLKLSLVWLVLAVLLRVDVQVRYWRAILIATGCLIVVYSLIALRNFPTIQIIDEGWDANVGWTFAHEGILYTRMNQGIFGIPERFVPVANVLPGYWLEVAGVGLLQARLVVYFGGLVMLALTYATALRLYRRKVIALVAVVLLASSYMFLYSSHMFRLDLYVGLSALLSFYLFLRAEQRPGLAAASGFILALSTEFHQNGLLLSLGAGLSLAAWILWRSIRCRRLTITRRDVYFIIGGVLGAVPYVFLHVLPDPAAFMRQYTHASNARRESNVSYSRSIFSYLADTLGNYLRFSPIEVALVFVAVIAALWNRRTRPLALLLVAVLVPNVIVIPSLSPLYAINVWPLVMLIFAGVLSQWITERRIVVLGLALAIVLPTFSAVYRVDQGGENTRLLRLANQLASTLKPDERVVALHYFFFAMPNNPNLIAPFMTDYAVNARAPVQGLDLWRQLKPDVFIVTTAFGEPLDTLAQTYRQEMGFVEVARFGDVGCCVLVFRRK